MKNKGYAKFFVGGGGGGRQLRCIMGDMLLCLVYQGVLAILCRQSRLFQKIFED